MDIARWLSSLGLGRYCTIFAENEITPEALPYLTEADLKELGVGLGARKLVLAAIAELGKREAHRPGTAARFPALQQGAQAPHAQAERRQLTVMFVDLAGSTALSGQLDPEEMRDVIRSYQRAVHGEITRLSGYVAKFMGDGVLAYFGWPRAHEDDAERAVRAALAVVKVVAALTTPASEPLGARVGIATGLVVVGDLVGEGSAQEEAVIGETPNLAARLQSLAEVNSVIVAGPTRRLLGEIFDLADLGSHDLKGFARPVQAWRVVGESRARGRFEALHGKRLTPLVGRDAEIAVLLDKWRSVKKGRGQVVLLSGEPGIGKSRIAAEVKRYISHARPFVLTFQCSPHHSDTAFHLLVGFFEHFAGLKLTSSPDAVSKRLAELAGMPESGFIEAAHYVARLLRPAGGTPERPLGSNPEQIKQKTIATLIALVGRMSRQRPVLVICEDAHWIDPTSQELLDLLVETIERLRVLLLITFRPGYTAHWLAQPQVAVLELNRLNEPSGAAMVSHIAGHVGVPQAVIDRIVASADGVPLFVEELSRTVFGTALDDSRGGGSPGGAAAPDLPIPASLSDSLTARLDQLGSGRAIAQICSVVGRSFTARLVCKVAKTTEAAVESALAGLVTLGLASVEGRPAEATYTFTHALIQESAYHSILRSHRRTLHRRLAAVLATDYSGTSDGAPEILAHHFEEAGDATQAIRSLQQAARAATARSGNVEAVRLLERALRLLATLPAGPERDTMELALLISLGPPQIATSGTAAPKVQKLYGRAIELCEIVPKSSDHFAAHWGWWFCAPDFKETLKRANLLSSLAEDLDDEELELQAHHCQWATQFNIGNQALCCEHIERGLAIYERGDYRTHAALYGGHDPKVCGLGERALSQWLTGHYNSSLSSIELSLAHAQLLQHGGSIGHSRDIQIMLYRYRDDAVKVLKLAEEIADFALSQGFTRLISQAKIFRGWALARLGDPTSGVILIGEGLAEHRSANSQEDYPVYLEMLAEVHGANSKPELGIPLLDEGVAIADRTGQQYWTAEMLRRKGVLLLQESATRQPEALACFERAMAVAEGQGARALLLRAMCNRAEIIGTSEKRAEVRDALALLHASFTEDLECNDVRNARCLLERLQSSV
jgi:class 3 adenylate cyclase/predicted ATPase